MIKMPIYYITHNPGKVDIMKYLMSKLDAQLKIEVVGYPEDKTTGRVEDVALRGAGYCANKFNKEVLVTDTGLFIDALNGFPGVHVSKSIRVLGLKGILNMLKDYPDRKATFKVAMAYASPKSTPVVFTKEVRGIIAEEPRGTGGFGFDSIFMPLGKNITFAENTMMWERIGGYGDNLKRFLDWYKSRKG